MGGLKSLNKGKRGEREVVKLLQNVVTRAYSTYGMESPMLQRNTLQSDCGGFDIVGLDWLAIEVKFCETLNIAGWWKQALQQARPGQQAVLFYRQSRVPWKVITLVSFPGSTALLPGTLSVEHFLAVVEESLCARLNGRAVYG